MDWGLKSSDIEKITGIFSNHPSIEEALLYGSRAKGNYKPGSDIDITLKGNDIDLQELNTISLELDDLLLPYTFDLSIYSHINNQDLLAHIRRVSRSFYKTNR